MSTELDKQARALFSELFFAKTQATKEKLILEAFSQVREQSIAECAAIEQKFKDFVEQYARLNGIRPQLATPKYDHYIEGASDFADFLSILPAREEKVAEVRCPKCWHIHRADTCAFETAYWAGKIKCGCSEPQQEKK